MLVDDPEGVLLELEHREFELLECRAARQYPWVLLDRIERLVDEKTGDVFQFHLTDPGPPPSTEKVPEGENGWFWQRELLETLMAEQKTLILKARQLGVTWLCAGYQLWVALTSPGTRHLIFRQTEDDVKEVVGRVWDMYCSLPEHLKFGTRVLKPAKGFRPSVEIELEHPDGRISRIQGKVSTERAGRGATVATVLFDEAAFIDKFRGIWTGIISTVGTKGKMFVVSTANGVSDEQTGDGNWYHRLWVTAQSRGVVPIFLAWFFHPDRDQNWYDTSDETRALDERDRAQEYPETAEEAFRLTTATWFSREALQRYAGGKADESGPHIRQPLYSFSFEPSAKDKLKARKIQGRDGLISVYREPVDKHEYGIGVDVATGRGRDYSAAYVVDLTNMEFVAEAHGKIDTDKFAYQLYYLGNFYGKKWGPPAWIAVERTTGWGETVINALRDGRDGRPAYPRLYRHVPEGRPNPQQQKAYGMPVNEATRTPMLSLLKTAIREGSLPWMTRVLYGECTRFVEWETGTSPRAAQGSSDDCVLAASMTLLLYRRYGHWPNKPTPKPSAPGTRGLGETRPRQNVGDGEWPVPEAA